MKRMSQLYPNFQRGISIKGALVIFLMLASHSVEAGSFANPLGYCFVVLQSLKNGDLDAPSDYLKGMHLRGKIKNAKRSKFDPLDLAADRIRIFSDEDLDVLYSLSPKMRAKSLDDARYFFSIKQLLRMRRESWYTRDEEGDTKRVERIQKNNALQVGKFKEMLDGGRFFDNIREKAKGHWYVFDFIQETVEKLDVTPRVFISNFIQGSPASLLDSAELRDAKFQFLLYYFRDKLSSDEVSSLVLAYQNQSNVTQSRNSLTFLDGTSTIH